MMISGVGSQAYNPYSSNVLKNSVSAKQPEEESMSVDAKKVGGRKPPQGPPPMKGAEGKSGPNVDTDEDGSWSVDEVESFITESGSSLDIEELFGDYDTNSDGILDSDEVNSVAENNGLQLPMMPKMMDLETKLSSSNTTYSSTNSSSDSDLIKQLISAYTTSSAEYQQNSYSFDLNDTFA